MLSRRDRRTHGGPRHLPAQSRYRPGPFGERIWAGNMWLYVAGILEPDVLAPDIDSSVLAGYPFAEKYLGFDGHPTTVYIKATSS